jgi:DNA-binding CsgD family transcriptional regulator
MTPFDYIAFLEHQPESSSIQWQRKTLKAFLVRHAWCIPLNTISQVKGVTVYMAGGQDRLVAFQSTRHEASLISAYYFEALESFRPGPSRISEVKDTEPDGTADLSAREIDCLHWAAAGRSNPEIAEALSVSQNTVRFHMKNAYRKLQVSSRVMAVARAREIGVIG